MSSKYFISNTAFSPVQFLRLILLCITLWFRVLSQQKQSQPVLIVISGDSSEQWLAKGFQFLSQELNLGSLDESQESQPLVHQGLEARSKFPQALASLKKCISQGGKICKVKKKTKNKKRCEVYYQRHSTSGRAKEKGFAYLRWKPGRDARLGRNAVGGPLTRRGTAKRQVNQLHTAVLLGLCLTLANCFLGTPPPPHLTCPRTFPNMHAQTFISRQIPAQRMMGEPWHHISWDVALSFLTPKEPFCTCVSLAPRMGNM